MKSPRAFTLIELLIVIAIIGILISLLFPAINAALDAAKKTQAKNDATQIATAVGGYETEYGRLPATNEVGAAITSDVINSLMGTDTTTAPNPRRIVFLEVNNAKKGKSGFSNNTFVDPWGYAYRIAFDGNYDNTITAGTNSEAVRKKVAVWNDPSLQTTATASQKKRRYVTSWD